MSGYKVSVIVPVYNAEKFLNRCVDSLLNQTLKDIEIILVDDGSKDSSSKICDEYAANYSNVNVLHLENSGPAHARNQGIELAQGKYIGFVDADDTIECQMYESLLSATNDFQYDIVISDYYTVNDNGKRLSRGNYKYGIYQNTEVQDVLLRKFYTDNFIALPNLWNKIYKNSFITDNNIRIDESIIRAEDFWFNFDCLCIAKTVNCVNQAFYNYNALNNPNSIMKRVRDTQYDEWVSNRKKLIERNNYGFDTNCSNFYKSFICNVIIHLKDLCQQRNMKKVDQILHDQFLLEIVNKYNFNLPKHIGFIVSLVRKRKFKTVKIMFYVWNLLHIN